MSHLPLPIFNWHALGLAGVHTMHSCTSIPLVIKATLLSYFTVLHADNFAVSVLIAMACSDTSHNPALDLAPFGRWMLRDKSAQRRGLPRRPLFMLGLDVYTP